MYWWWAFLVCRNVTYLNPAAQKHIPEPPMGVVMPRKVCEICLHFHFLAQIVWNVYLLLLACHLYITHTLHVNMVWVVCCWSLCISASGWCFVNSLIVYMKLVFFGVLSMSIFKNNKCLKDSFTKILLALFIYSETKELSGNMLLLSVPYNVGFLHFYF